MPMKERNIVKRTLDLKKLPRLSPEKKARLDAVASMPDAQIDYSDAAFLPDAVWMKAAAELPHTKQQITLRIDAEVLDFFKHGGKRYQSRINAVLRSYVEAHKTHAQAIGSHSRKTKEAQS
ncbi:MULTISPECIES: BrnA antitoxin family protein [unclassified Undibacterium]|uniref:BrnA antitoxin family protein n=1 Tax=unclassified Undibacterium TaxID=2630295 RepID=UPI002AC904C9|nr:MULTISPECIES: BrnA antitoxin family protein [unclassified Undibacterium]MEB0138889.1 BrnA antitoxin family protein [Undibacterium sp. CCC2.1]MEB0174091.1 BrnA antitoxin family protein [Undibacterium sp. CCC1.1]MEB0178051.1 BrnA antitoxin family protein [Undibacterium sp. CCC3.4]MEB0217253.1 BrnA antitoxin family protein [Undibacterium sp. 5I2]WPX44725.1 BrnA antitoxin family protein [Undibacterium sp. CCC3.4]